MDSIKEKILAGGRKGNNTVMDYWKAVRDEYDKNPTRCKTCDGSLEYTKSPKYRGGVWLVVSIIAHLTDKLESIVAGHAKADTEELSIYLAGWLEITSCQERAFSENITGILESMNVLSAD